jgi:hypothetical protein
MSIRNDHGVPKPLPLRSGPRSRIVADRARQLLEHPELSDEERVRIDGALRVTEARPTGGSLTRPGVRKTDILDGAARDVGAIWTRIYGAPPWGTRHPALRWLDRFWL